jgi:hypothetical protein
MYLLKVKSKNIFCLASILKVTDKKSRTGAGSGYASQSYGFGSGTVPKCHGSRTCDYIELPFLCSTTFLGGQSKSSELSSPASSGGDP